MYFSQEQKIKAELKKLAEYGKLKRKGYVIEKKHIKSNVMQHIRETLTVTPVVHKDYAKNVQSFPIFFENKKSVFLPPYWALDNIGKAAKNFVKNGIGFTSELKTIYPPRDYQEPIVKMVLKQLKSIKGGFITIGCGGGKTFLAIYLATLLKQKTLIIVHTSVLLDQWIERINYFVPNAKIGKVKGKVFDIEGKDFVIAMLQTIGSESRGYTSKTFADFGVTIYDEAHHMGAPSFSRTLPITTTKYTIGLSATPERNDKLEKVFYWYIGPSAWYDRKREGIYTMCKIVRYEEPNFTEKKSWTGGYDLNKMVNQIIENQHRNRFIIKQIKHYAKMGRQTLVLSTRRTHLELMKSMFDLQPLTKDNGEIATSGLYVGGMKATEEQGLITLKGSQIDEIIENNIDKIVDEEDRKLLFGRNGSRRTKIKGTKVRKIELIENAGIEFHVEKKASLEDSAKSDVLFATYQLVSEGTDIPTLNTLIMASPKKEVEQVVGRIQRAETAHKPLVLDICDMFSVYINQGKFRQRFYKRQDYYIEEIEYDTTENKPIPIINDKELEKKCKNIKDLLKKGKKKKKKKKKSLNEPIEFGSCLIMDD